MGQIRKRGLFFNLYPDENSANAEGIKPNILEDLKTAKSPSPDSELGRSFENDDNIDEVRCDEQSNR